MLSSAPLVAQMPKAMAETFVGVCLMELQVTYTGSLPKAGETPLGTRVTISGTATCTTSAGNKTATLSGSAASPQNIPTFTCAGGVGTSLSGGSFSIPGGGTNSGVMTVAIAGGVAHVALSSPIDGITGSGVFVQDPMGTVSCPTNGLATTTWCGAFAFAVTGPVSTPPDD